MSVDNSGIDIVPYRQGFVGITAVQDLSEWDPVQVSTKSSLIKMIKDEMIYMNGF